MEAKEPGEKLLHRMEKWGRKNEKSEKEKRQGMSNGTKPLLLRGNAQGRKTD